MNNPWLEIPVEEYESHMLTIGQLQIMNQLMAQAFQKYKPANVAILGCASGNGFEHLNYSELQNVYGVDINSYYLKVLKDRYQNQISKLKLLCLDIENDSLAINYIDCYFLSLILEYVSPLPLIQKIQPSLNPDGKICLIIQENTSSDFVSKTSYESLEQLSAIAKTIDKNTIIVLMENQGFCMDFYSEHPCKAGKILIYMEFSIAK
ncbi:MAG: class I SAM-dependent methyltransferase [Bacteroidales bacterium]